MAGWTRSCFIIWVSAAVLLTLFPPAFRLRQEVRRRRDVLDATEIPAEHIDPAAIDLTPLVNTLINSSQSGSRQLFSLLSVTSHSSLALHKLTLLVYNISSIRSVERDVFRRRFCYCVTNDTNDLTDFTAVLLDVIGNSTSYLHEIFKSASILSVSHRNNSGCIYICVMAGKTGPEAPHLWDVGSISPLFNQTIVEGPHTGNVSSFRFPVDWNQLSDVTSAASSSSSVSPATTAKMAAARQLTSVTQQGKQTAARAPEMKGTANTERSPAPTVTPSPVISRTPLGTTTRPGSSSAARYRPTPVRPAGPVSGGSSAASRDPEEPEEPEEPGCPWTRPGRGRAPASGSGTTTVGAHKLQPCVLELCKFFSQCLCGAVHHRTRTARFCVDSHRWYEKHTAELCRRIRRVSFSRNLKQRCLTKMCNKL